MEIHVLRTGPLGVNTLVVSLGNGRAFVVDPASCRFSRDESAVFDFLESSALRPVAILLTHGHFDHVAGLPFLREKYPSVPILIHERDAGMVGKDSRILQGRDLDSMGFPEFLPFVSDLPGPTSFLEDGKSILECLDFSDFDSGLRGSLSRWMVIHTPGHTPGCVCLLNETEKVLISGDTLFYHSWGRTDLPGGSEDEIRKSLANIVSTISDDVRIFPGHEKFGFTKKD